MAAVKPQGQALRVLAHSQPCPFPPATLHLQVAKAERRSASGGAQIERLIRFQYDVMLYANGQIMNSNGQIYWRVLYKNAVIIINYRNLRMNGRLKTRPFPTILSFILQSGHQAGIFSTGDHRRR